MKRIISLMLSFMMFCSCIAINVFAEQQLAENQILMGENVIGSYSDDNKTLTIEGNGEMFRVEDEDNINPSDLPFTVKKSVERIKIVGNITFISDYAFSNLNIKEFITPKSVKEIGSYAFLNCKKLKKINLGNIVKLGKSALENTAIQTVKLPKTLKYFGYYVADEQDYFTYDYGTFNYCKNLETIDVGECLSKNIADFSHVTTLVNCKNFKNFKVSKNNKKYSVKNGILYNKNKTQLIMIPMNKKIKTFNVQNTVKRIKNGAFANQRYLTKINLNKNIEHIEDYAFANTKITKISIPDKVKFIDENLFQNCRKLKSVTLSSNTKYIGFMAFADCVSLKELEIPKNVEWFGLQSFINCKNLSKIIINSTKKAPVMDNTVFSKEKSAIKFYTKNKKVAKQLKNNLKNSDVKKAQIYVGKKLIYKNIK